MSSVMQGFSPLTLEQNLDQRSPTDWSWLAAFALKSDVGQMASKLNCTSMWVGIISTTINLEMD